MPSLTQPARRVEEVYGLREMIQYDASFVLLGNGVCPPVATGGPRIEDVNGEYQQVFAVVATELTRRHIDNPITYGSLWDWYGRWSTGDLPSYQSRRVFVGELISPLVNRIRTGRVEEVQPTGWQRIDRTVGELRDRLASARNEEQFQAIGLLGRDTLISLAQAVHVSKKHPALDGVEPSSSDGKRKLEAYFAKELADGSNEEARWRIVDEHGVFEGFTRILDFYHAAQHLSMAAEHLFGKASAKADRWYRSWRHKLRHTPNAVAGLIRSLSYHRRKLRRRSERYRQATTEMGYFRNNRDKMEYAGYHASGLIISSGPVEAAAKTIVGHRLKRSGMRWTRHGGQQILNLRVQVQSKRWDAFWNWYLQQITPITTLKRAA